MKTLWHISPVIVASLLIGFILGFTKAEKDISATYKEILERQQDTKTVSKQNIKLAQEQINLILSNVIFKAKE
jgi:uncharacterized protein YneF (UPF0154 family)